ncbi:P-loop NTPase [Candidatus Woesearchaeota archaeon]|nr:P-loop NTPase [Candidatus Woesearchaeota archaeon]
MKTIAILSGKGGVGKSSLTASLAVLLSKKKKLIAADCDVDAPNLALVLGVEKFEEKENIKTSEKAKVISKTCPECKEHVDVCMFGAILWDEKNKNPVINKFLCEGCGACMLAFPKGTVKLEKVENASINSAKTSYGFPIISGHLKMGESGSGKVVTAVKQKAEDLAEKEKADVLLVDSSPGIGCPVVASIQGSDYIISITEPTPSALNDLQRVLKVAEHFNVPYGLVINKWDINKDFTKKVEEFAQENNIQVLGKLPHDRAFVDALVNLKPIVEQKPAYKKIFQEILDHISILENR